MKNLTQIKSELTTKEISIFESLVRLGDSIQLAYEIVLSERLNLKSVEFYRNGYGN